MTKSKETLLTHIIEELRATVPVTAEAPEEKIIIPGDIEEVLLLSSLLIIKYYYFYLFVNFFSYKTD